MARTFAMGGVLSRTFAVWFRNFLPFTFLSLMVQLPILVYLVILFQTKPGLGDESWQVNLVNLATMLLNMLLTATVTYGVFQQLHGNPIGLGKCIRIGLSRVFPVLLISLLFGLLVGLGFLCLIIPGIILLLVYYVVVPVTVVERPGVGGAFSRSAHLTRGHRWSILGVVLLAGIIIGAPSFLIGMVMAEKGFVLMLLVSALMSVILSPFYAVANAVVYHDLRVVKEDADLKTMIKAFE